VNGPGSIDVHVLALVNRPRESIVFANPLGRAVGGLAAAGSSRPGFSASYPQAGYTQAGYNPADSARDRLRRSLRHLRGLGLRASGDIETSEPYWAIQREAARGGYDRVLLLVPDRRPGFVRRLGLQLERRPGNRLRGRLGGMWLALDRSLETRLRRSLNIPVDAVDRSAGEPL
ncbi:MAG TPA: hypothetical protein VGN54_04570, partial [Mycobacteriales bacterium]|nr:hypothetical protein [Mycobacteriales bacterium]